MNLKKLTLTILTTYSFLLCADENLRDLNTKHFQESLTSQKGIISSENQDKFLDSEHSPFEIFYPEKEIGCGTYSKVFLCHDQEGKPYAIKKYFIQDELLIALLKKEKTSVSKLLKTVSENEFSISLNASHPNLLKIHHLIFKNPTKNPDDFEAYVIMDYIPGNVLNTYLYTSKENSKIYLLQLLNVLEYLTEKQMIADDLWSENLMIDSRDNTLKLIDLGGIEIVKNTVPISFELIIDRYFDVINSLARRVDDKAFTQFLSTSKEKLLSKGVNEESFSTKHLPLLYSWIQKIKDQLALPLIQHQHYKQLETKTNIKKVYEKECNSLPNHFSFVTAQSEGFIAYELIARTLYQKLHPGLLTKAELNNQVLLRYPQQYFPNNLEELFKRCPIREDYDTISTLVASCLVSASPSLNENEEDESALAIFKKGDREELLESCIEDLFYQEHIHPDLYQDELEELIEDFPRTNKAGVLTQIFVPKVAAIDQVIYHSRAYGIPYEGTDKINKIVSFFEEYAKGKKWKDDPIPK